MNFLPSSASTFAPEVDLITLALLLVSGIIIVGVAGLIIVFSIRYRASVHPKPEKTRTYLWMELSWAFIPLIISVGIFAWAALVYYRMHAPPPGSMEIYVVAKQWMWKFQHTDGRQELNELHVPVKKPIRLIMSSQDVIHSLGIPAFRIKQDVLPGRYTEVWFEATQPGEYRLFCTEYCGTEHAQMGGKVIAMDPAHFAQWKASGTAQPSSAAPSLATRGRELFTRLGCISCHGQGVKDAKKLAPDLAGLYGSKVGLRTGQSVTADENYIRESIVRPNAKIVMGYGSIMPVFEGKVSEDDLGALIAYIKTLKEHEGLKP